jgi:hypothetical protein
LFKVGILVAVLTVAAYLAGAGLARRWMAPPPVVLSEAQVVPTQVIPQATTQSAVWLEPGDPVEGTLDEEGTLNDWQFRGQAGQSVTIETWLHPGSGSSVDAELAIHLIGPDGTVLAQETGSVFLPPYLVAPDLAGTDLYRVRVMSALGAPGRYSLLLTLAGAPVPVTPGAPPSQRLTPTPPLSHVTAFTPGQFQWPTHRRAISGWIFHDPGNPGHIGLDIAAQMWDPIVAVAGGVVVFAEWGGGYGNLVIVEHAGGWRSYYAHLTEIVVESGQEVQQGDLLGGAGTTGYSTGTHLHFELRYQGRPVDPHVYLP